MARPMKEIEYKFDLKYAMSLVKRDEYVEIIINRKFAIFKGFKKSIHATTYIDIINDIMDLEIDRYDVEDGALKKWKIYLNDILTENLVMDRENDWYDEKIRKEEERKNVNKMQTCL